MSFFFPSNKEKSPTMLNESMIRLFQLSITFYYVSEWRMPFFFVLKWKFNYFLPASNCSFKAAKASMSPRVVDAA